MSNLKSLSNMAGQGQQSSSKNMAGANMYMKQSESMMKAAVPPNMAFNDNTALARCQGIFGKKSEITASKKNTQSGKERKTPLKSKIPENDHLYWLSDYDKKTFVDWKTQNKKDMLKYGWI